MPQSEEDQAWRESEEDQAWRELWSARILTGLTILATLVWAAGASWIVGGYSASVPPADTMIVVTGYGLAPVGVCFMPWWFMLAWSEAGYNRKASQAAAWSASALLVGGCAVLVVSAYHNPGLMAGLHPAPVRLTSAILVTAVIQSMGLFLWVQIAHRRPEKTQAAQSYYDAAVELSAAEAEESSALGAYISAKENALRAGVRTKAAQYVYDCAKAQLEPLKTKTQLQDQPRHAEPEAEQAKQPKKKKIERKTVPPREWVYDLPTTRHDPHVYFVRNGNRVKIGTSTNIRSRMAALSLRPEHVVLAVPGGQGIERQMHVRFAEYRDGNTEWFQDTGDLADFIRTERDKVRVES